MGPNGSGKSTLSYVLAGRDGYEVTAGEVRFDGEDLLALAPDERAADGVFLAFQYPLEIPGVTTMTFLRTALNAQRKARGEAGAVDARNSCKLVREAAAALNIDHDMLQARRQCRLLRRREEAQRDPADGAVGAEACHSRRDRFRPRHRRAEDRRRGRQRLRAPARSMMVITHYQRLLDYIVPDVVHVLAEGPHRQAPAARSWRWNWKQGLRRNISERRLESHERREVKAIKTAAEAALAENYPAARSRLPGGKAVAAQREAAFGVFAREGLPHRRIEDWKYTDLRALMREAKPLAPPPDAAAKAQARAAGAMLGDVEARRLVFIDGAFVPELSDTAALEAGLTVARWRKRSPPAILRYSGSLARLAPATDVAVALNTALMGDGAVIRIAPGANIARPLHLVFVASGKPAASFTRSLVVIGERARAMLIESHEGPRRLRLPGQCRA